MDLGDRAARVRCLVRDRAGQFAVSFNGVMADAGIEVVKIPPRCPRVNCFAERFVLTVRTRVTDRMLIFGERHLRQVLAVCAAHANARWPYRALRLRPPRPTSPVPEPVHGRIRRRPILGGLISEGHQGRASAPGRRQLDGRRITGPPHTCLRGVVTRRRAGPTRWPGECPTRPGNATSNRRTRSPCPISRRLCYSSTTAMSSGSTPR